MTCSPRVNRLSAVLWLLMLLPMEALSFRALESARLYRHTETRTTLSCAKSSDENHAGISSKEIDQVLEVAMEASAKAATVIRDNLSSSAQNVKLKSTSRDLLTTVDPQCEKIIRETIAEAFPDHVILGEEGVEPGKEAAIAALEDALAATKKWLWIVDPIDGTTNFASGIPLNAPSVAALFQGEIVVGVIHDPHRNEIWTAVRGQGTRLNGDELMRVESSPTTLSDAVIGCESPAGQESLEVAVRGIPALMPKCRTLRLLGSTAVMMPWVAQGRLNAYWSPDECAWDHAAGALIVEEAGGILTDLDGSEFTIRTRKFLASQNEQLHNEILAVLKETGIQ